MKHSIFRRIAPLVVITAVMTIQLSSAAAASEVDLHFEELTVERTSGQLVVDYTIDRNDWFRVARLGVAPRFDLVVETTCSGKTTLSSDVEIREREERLYFDVGQQFDRVERAQFQPVETYRTRAFGSVHLRGDFTHTFDFSLEHGSSTYRGAQKRGSTDRRTSETSHRERRRGRRGQNHRSRNRNESNVDDRAAIIDACGEAASFESAREHCVSHAPDITGHDAVAAVEACGEATSHTSHFRSCIETAADFDVAPSSSIRACGQATSFGSHFQSCLQAAGTHRQDPSAIIDSCGNSTNFSSRIPSCIEESRS